MSRSHTTLTYLSTFPEKYLKKTRIHKQYTPISRIHTERVPPLPLRWNWCIVWSSTQCVRGLDILNLQLFVLHNTDTISFPRCNSRFLHYNKQKPLVISHWSGKTGHGVDWRTGVYCQCVGSFPHNTKILSCPWGRDPWRPRSISLWTVRSTSHNTEWLTGSSLE